MDNFLKQSIFKLQGLPHAQIVHTQNDHINSISIKSNSENNIQCCKVGTNFKIINSKKALSKTKRIRVIFLSFARLFFFEVQLLSIWLLIRYSNSSLNLEVHY